MDIYIAKNIPKILTILFRILLFPVGLRESMYSVTSETVQIAIRPKITRDGICRTTVTFALPAYRCTNKLYHNVHNPLVPRLISQSLDSCQLRGSNTPASQHPRPAADCGIGLTPVTRVHVTTRQDSIVDGAGPAA